MHKKYFLLLFNFVTYRQHVAEGFVISHHRQGILSFPLSHQKIVIQKPISGTSLLGIRGFRSWFESQFPDAMIEITHGKTSRQSESFHHLLIDVNQLLHVTLRRARSEGHALTMLIQELDRCIDLATPKKSVVLAFDGPPAAAKLATQRRRRYGTVLRAERKKMRYEILKQRGVIQETYQEYRHRKAEKEEETLKITPGTEFMEKAHDAVLYWAWQRLDSLQGKLSNVKIFISPSTVPGEGEVKLLDWLFQAGRDGMKSIANEKDGRVKRSDFGRIVAQGESVAIYGGDSDLVLEGLVIPPTITHNVFVILPSGGRSNYCVSLWQTTLTLAQMLGKKFDQSSIMRVRTDLVLLLIMNGNDYLPKLRGSSGFNKLFHTYLRLLKKSLKNGEQNPYLIDPITLEYNLSFCKLFFQELASTAPTNLSQPEKLASNQQSFTPLSYFYSMLDSGFLPQPAVFERVPYEDNPEIEFLQLKVGQDGHGVFYTFHLKDMPSITSLKNSKQILANMALEQILGEDYMEWNEYVSNDDDDFDDERPDYDSSGPKYTWELSTPAPASVEEYLKGMIWNLASYQDGICCDYGWNYGRRVSPTAEEVVSYLNKAENEGRVIDRKSLLGDEFISPLSAGMSCLAALPSQVSHLIPEPYRALSMDSTIDEIYGDCMSPETNVFDLDLFRKQIEQRTKFNPPTATLKSNRRKLMVSDSLWICMQKTRKPLTHQFDPPKPFSERLSYLRPNPKIRISHITASDKPRWLRDNDEYKNNTQQQLDELYGMTQFLTSAIGDNKNLVDVGFKTAFEYKKTKRSIIKTEEIRIDIQNPPILSLHAELRRMQEFGLEQPKDAICNRDNHNSMECLQHLVDSSIIKSMTWEYSHPSTSKYAELNPHQYEYIQLKIQLNDSSEHLLIGRDRNVDLLSRKSIKRLLADQMMNILSRDHGDWQLKSSKEIKKLLYPGSSESS